MEYLIYGSPHLKADINKGYSFSPADAAQISHCLIGIETMPITKLVYVSGGVKPFSPSDLGSLLQIARAKNEQVGVTGLLLYHKQSFFQILEGESEAVAKTFARIAQDKRHHRLMLLSKLDSKERSFGEWSMGFVDADHATARLPGFVKLLEAKSTFLDLQPDSELVNRLIEGFRDGQWRRGIES